MSDNRPVLSEEEKKTQSATEDERGKFDENFPFLVRNQKNPSRISSFHYVFN